MGIDPEIDSSWPSDLFVNKNYRPDGSSDFLLSKQVVASSSASAQDVTVCEFELDDAQAGRLLGLACGQIIPGASPGQFEWGGYDITWRLKVSRGNVKSSTQEYIEIDAPLSDGFDLQELALNLGQRASIKVVATVPATVSDRILAAKIYGWVAEFVGGDPYQS